MLPQGLMRADGWTRLALCPELATAATNAEGPFVTLPAPPAPVMRNRAGGADRPAGAGSAYLDAARDPGLGREASQNSRNSAVTRNTACSAMSTALSPIRSRLRAIST
jgi:hypothetical protein